MLNERQIRDIAQRHGLDVHKRITTGTDRAHFAEFELVGDGAADAWAAEVKQHALKDFIGLRRSAIDGRPYIEFASVWCECEPAAA